MIPGFDLTQFVVATGPWIALLVIAAIIFAESGLLIGFFLPGDSLLFSAGFLISTGMFDITIHLFVVVMFVAAVLGDGVGYVFGKRIGHKIFRRPNSLLFRKENIEKAEAFYKKHGSITIVAARFIPIVRTFAPIVAGVGKMRYKTFLTFNIIGALLWAVGISYAGYYIGELLHQLSIEIDAVLLPIIALIIIASIAPPAIHILKDKTQRTRLWEGTKKQIRVVLRKR